MLNVRNTLRCRTGLAESSRRKIEKTRIALALLAGLMLAVPLAARADDTDLLWFVRRPDVLKEIGLSAKTLAELRTLTDRQDQTLFPSRNLAAERQTAIQTPLIAETWLFLDKALTTAERTKFDQLRRRGGGLTVFRDQDVRDSLSLTGPQAAKIDDRFTRLTDELKASAATGRKTNAKVAKATRPATTPAEAQRDAQKDILAVLTPDQVRKLSDLLGPPVDVSQFRGPRFAAPGFSRDGNWIAGQPTNLSDLRGKVVLVHFFASECYNCQNNYPHYRAWEKEFDPDKIAIVGVQTPELSVERDARHVASQVKAAKLNHPILMDADSAVWKAWGTTSWPTVYVVDKQGRVVTWWSGELDWQGAGVQNKLADLARTLSEEP